MRILLDLACIIFATIDRRRAPAAQSQRIYKMLCSACSYMMDSFDKECPRCQGKGSSSPSPPVVTMPDPLPRPLQSLPTQDLKDQITSHSMGPAYKHGVQQSDITLLESLCGIGILGGLATSVYYFLFFDTSVEVPVNVIFGTEIGGGRVNNFGLMAQRQNGILFGLGLAIFCTILFFVLQNQNKSDD